MTPAAFLVAFTLALAGLGLARPALADPLPAATPADGARCVGRAPVVVDVADAPSLQAALDGACPGQTIRIAPGRYVGKFRVGPEANGTADAPVTITAADGLGSVVVDGAGTAIVWKFSGSRHFVLRDLVITGGGYHGVFFDRSAGDIAIVGNRIHDNHAKRPLDSHAEIKGSGPEGRPARIAIRGNEIYHSTHPAGGNFQGIDCNFCDAFEIVGNHIHDINGTSKPLHSLYDRGSCIQMKSHSRATIIADNRIERCQIAVVLGGEGLESPENVGGIVRNNVILDSVEIGIAVVNARQARIYHNTVLGAPQDLHFGRDARFADSRNEADVANNLLSTAPSGAPSGEARAAVRLRGNRVMPGLTADTLFVDAASGNFEIDAAMPPLDAGTVDLGEAARHDYRGRTRTTPQDAGAIARRK